PSRESPLFVARGPRSDMHGHDYCPRCRWIVSASGFPTAAQREKDVDLSVGDCCVGRRKFGTDWLFDPFRFAHELPCSLIAPGPRNTLGKPTLRAPDQHGNFGRKSALLRATLGDTILHRGTQWQQPVDLVLQRADCRCLWKEPRGIKRQMIGKL